jgi:hypothetical protein
MNTHDQQQTNDSVVQPEHHHARYTRDIVRDLRAAQFSVRMTPSRYGHPRHALVQARTDGSVWRDNQRLGWAEPSIGDPGEPLVSAPGLTVWHAGRLADDADVHLATAQEVLYWLSRRRPRADPKPVTMTARQGHLLACWNWPDAAVGHLEHLLTTHDDPKDVASIRAELAQRQETAAIARAEALAGGVPEHVLSMPGRLVQQI